MVYFPSEKKLKAKVMTDPRKRANDMQLGKIIQLSLLAYSILSFGSAQANQELSLFEASLLAVRKKALREAIPVDPFRTEEEHLESQPELTLKVQEVLQNFNLPEEVRQKVFGNKIISVATSRHHSLFLNDEGEVFSLGRGASGELGLGNIQEQLSPKRIESEEFVDQRIIQVVAGDFHSLLLTEMGDVFSFGRGSWGELGHGDTENQLLPKRIDVSLLKNKKIIQIAAGTSNSLLLSEDGKVFSFGSGSEYRLGLRQNQNQLTPRILEEKYSRDQRIVPFTEKIIQASVGESHSLLLSDSGEVFSYGSGDNGYLGQGDPLGQPIPKRIEAEALKDDKIIQIAAGKTHSLLLSKNGNVYSFGAAYAGQLGHGTSKSQYSPKKIESETLRSHKIVKIAAGYDHSLLLTAEGKVFAFGYSNQKQMIPKIIQIEDLKNLKIIDIAGGFLNSLVLTETGDVFSFGERSLQSVESIKIGWIRLAREHGVSPW
jgi:alpha-tubulin suppressor-like RCC1 family protein